MKKTDKTAARPRRWGETEVETRLYEAVDTLRRVPAPYMQIHVTTWPAYVHDSHEAYGYTGFRAPRSPATAAAITRLDETLEWLKWLPRDAQRILWSRANGFSWRRIAGFVGKAPNTCRAWNLAGLHYLCGRLNGAKGNHGHSSRLAKSG